MPRKITFAGKSDISKAVAEVLGQSEPPKAPDLSPILHQCYPSWSDEAEKIVEERSKQLRKVERKVGDNEDDDDEDYSEDYEDDEEDDECDEDEEESPEERAKESAQTKFERKYGSRHNLLKKNLVSKVCHHSDYAICEDCLESLFDSFDALVDKVSYLKTNTRNQCLESLEVIHEYFGDNGALEDIFVTCHSQISEKGKQLSIYTIDDGPGVNVLVFGDKLVIIARNSPSTPGTIMFNGVVRDETELGQLKKKILKHIL